MQKHNDVGSDCPLCGTRARELARAAGRPLLACGECALCFVAEPYHVSPEEERARYRLHRNTRDNAGYVRMLGTVVTALQRQLPPAREMRVLDYGCGTAEVLVGLLREAGYAAEGYDPCFRPDTDLARPYEAVVSTETFEHFRRPAEDIARVVALVRPGGLLVVMTALHDGVADWGRWHYALDSTHVVFYAARTFAWIAARWGLRLLQHNARNLVVLRRPAGTANQPATA